MALDKATLKTAVEAAFNAQWSAGDVTTLKADVLAAFDTAFSVVDPGAAATTQQACADAVADAVVKYVHGADGTKVADLATALSNATDTFVKGATLTFGPLAVGIQTTTGPGAPTGPPAVPVPVAGMVS